jgi:hypothetical protein
VFPEVHSQGAVGRACSVAGSPDAATVGLYHRLPGPDEAGGLLLQVTGRPIVEGSGDTMAGISLGDVDLGFQRVGDYRPPRWPDGEHPKQYHLDFEVSEIEPEQRRVIELGATL